MEAGHSGLARPARAAGERGEASRRRRFPLGPELQGGGVHFRVWAPDVSSVEAVFQGGGPPPQPLEAEGEGYFSGLVRGAGEGARYRLRLDGGQAFPDPASPSQPEGPHGPSEVIDHERYAWRDAAWPGLAPEGQVLYELHVGTFTPEGTWAAAELRLAELAQLGVTAIEMMPVADFPGRFNWGYDGACWFAPCRLYGRPDELRRFVDRAHQAGLGVILDVVYNHFAPDGNYLPKFASGYTTRKYRTDWGLAVNLDGPGSAPVRDFVLANVRHWIERYRFDGLRVDATQSLYDLSSEHIVAAIARTARRAAGRRRVLLLAENEPQRARLLQAPPEGYGFDAMWSDDFHHCAAVALTGRRQGYFSGYLGAPQELVSAVKRGFLYQGQYCSWQRKRRGTPANGLARRAFVHYLENHDQLGNAPGGRRLLERCAPGRYRAMMAVLLLGPETPLLFQGQERGSRAPFHFFADHGPELAEKVREGRREFLAQFPSLAQAEAAPLIPDPAAESTWRRCVLRSGEGDPRSAALVRDLLALRRRDPVFGGALESVDGAVLGAEAFVLRFEAREEPRLLVVNLGAELALPAAAEPLLGPPAGRRWSRLWSSEEPIYGGAGTPPLEDPSWALPAQSAVVLAPARYGGVDGAA
ncbi:MAG: malto-oligosyltrehalose trehalohydrolase [Elusimicrobia bacterium]|nr:malto-oligosyltrehalose trehalohydrolase [Elusimicrobiota bacterium]